ncbi:hypothetical protein EVAR_11746_1 [Eumeta japonica]|uniref:Uncharacterized protein n=1 Tax=Eumeta variegata TaxID=151549 RepID=A0A4C1UQH0_EUMVA|nr:hypothetical protein EVAR_11746_1 [Eumeta japonica]
MDDRRNEINAKFVVRKYYRKVNTDGRSERIWVTSGAGPRDVTAAGAAAAAPPTPSGMWTYYRAVTVKIERKALTSPAGGWRSAVIGHGRTWRCARCLVDGNRVSRVAGRPPAAPPSGAPSALNFMQVDGRVACENAFGL